MIRSLDEFSRLWNHTSDKNGIKLILPDEYRDKHYIPYKKPPLTDAQKKREDNRIDFLCQREIQNVAITARPPATVMPSKFSRGKRAQ